MWFGLITLLTQIMEKSTTLNGMSSLGHHPLTYLVTQGILKVPESQLTPQTIFILFGLIIVVEVINYFTENIMASVG